MSTLWTPGGEVPIDRSRPADEPARDESEATAGQDQAQAGGDAAAEAELEAMRRQVLDAPAADVVAQHAVALYELAALHLSAPEPRLADARLAIDALTALVEGLSGRLGQAERALAEALPQLKMAYVEAADRQS